jgi:hypothetical protein
VNIVENNNYINKDILENYYQPKNLNPFICPLRYCPLYNYSIPLRAESATRAFTFETVDGAVNGQVCLALDKNGNPHIAYAGVGGKLMLASRDVDGTWIHEELFGGGLVGAPEENRICLEIDSQGNPHIAYRELSSGNLYYGFKRDNRWEFTPVPTSLFFHDPRGVSGYAFKLHSGRLTPELRDTPHFVFHDLTSNSLGYTRKVGGEFKITKVSEGNAWSVGLNPSMDFDDLSETFLIAYTEELDNGPGTEPLSRVSVTRIQDPLEGTIGFKSLLEQGRFRVVRPTSITSDTKWCVAYGDFTNNTLKASVFDFGLPEPHKEIVAATVFPVTPSVAKAPGKDYRIAYGDDNKLKLASRNQFGEWNVEIIDPSGGEIPSLAYDNLGNAHIAYMLGNTLKYAKGKTIGDRCY